MRRTPILWAAHLSVLCSTSLDPTGRLPAERSPGGQLQSALSAAILANDRTFAIPAGVYHFEAHDLLADSARNFVIAPVPDAAVKLLFRCNWGLVLRSCANVSVRDITITYDPPCFSQAGCRYQHYRALHSLHCRRRFPDPDLRLSVPDCTDR